MNVSRFAVLLATALSVPTMANALEVSDSWIRESIPGQSVTAAYLTLRNGDKRECTVTSASSAVAGRVEIHEHRHKDGQMQMRRLESLVVPAGASRSFEPGGLHLMLMALEKPLRAGDEVALTLHTTDCGDVQSTFPVKPIQ